MTAGDGGHAALAQAQALLQRLHQALRERVQAGRRIDDYQLAVRRYAGLAARLAAARALCEAVGPDDGRGGAAATLFAAEAALEAVHRVERHAVDFGLTGQAAADLVPVERRAVLAASLSEAAFRDLAARLAAADFANHDAITGDDADLMLALRDTTRRFAAERVQPLAQRIHLDDLLVPEELIDGMAQLGFFGMSIPADYGGTGMSNLAMVVATEELSAASLPAAGSLITRPEVLAKAVLAGGSETQKQRWLGPVARGELMVGVAVTEPDVGSDVAALRCRATPAVQDGVAGWLIDGAKAWSTFAGRADVLALLARSDPDPAAGHRGLSLFIVDKERCLGHEFDLCQPAGGRLSGKAERTPGYRGMHSFTLQFERWFVPGDRLIGTAGRGFYYQMAGFAAGRLQTAARATGLAQASLMAAGRYSTERRQFGRPIGEFQSTAYELGWMALRTAAARALTHAAARAMDAGAADAGLQAAMAKLFACRVAVDVSQRAQLLHGGWGYAEEFPVARYVADALVLPIFEGVEPILELKVIGRQLLGGGA
jgi:(2S)-methylsuccinyl-CoA dehydrogenase